MSVEQNLVANYFAQGWTALMGLAFIPVYIKLLGIEAYGLIGVFALLQAWLMLLDMGLSFALNREMARFRAGAHTAQSIRDLLRSVEIVAIAVAGMIAAGVAASAGWLAHSWLQAQALAQPVVRDAIMIMGLVVACRVIETIYHGAILGLQKQVWLALAGSVLATLRWGGAAAVLVWGRNSIEAFFLWQALVSALSIVVLCAALYRHLPRAPQPVRFSLRALQGLRRFAAGLLATSGLALILTQLDKVLLSRLLSLEAFGYYTLAAVAAAALLQLATPVTQALYPRLTELATSDDKPALEAAYHHGAQLVTVLIAPAAMLLIIFGPAILRMWTGDALLAERAAPLLAVLTVGTLLNGFMNMPYMLQLAHGWSSLAARVNAAAVVLLVPALLWVVPRHGAMGAAWIWVALNAGYLTVGIYLMHRRLLPAEKLRWYAADLASPVLASAAVVGLAYTFQPAGLSQLAELLWLSLAGTLAVAAAIAAAPGLRRLLVSRIVSARAVAP